MNQTLLTVVGNLATDPTARETGEGVSVTNFRLASSERRFDRESQQWVDGDSLFIAVSCWRRLAERVQETLRKGDPVVVTGKVTTRNFEQDGNTRVMTEMTAYAVGPNLARCAVELRRTPHRFDEPLEVAA